MLHDNSLFSKVGSATIATLGRAVNTLLTPTTMGGEKFHITVTIDNEKALQIAGLPEFSAAGISSSRNKSAIADFGAKKTTRALIPARRSGLKFFCHVRPLKQQTSSDFFPPTYVSALLRVVDCASIPIEESGRGCGYI
jgi:hypothetical protein